MTTALAPLQELVVEPMGLDATGFFVRGHVDRGEVHRAIREQMDVFAPAQGIEQGWWRCVPNWDREEGGYLYHPAQPHTCGAFAVTFTHHGGPSCTWCAACTGKVERRIAERERVRNRKMLLGIWRRAEAGQLIRLDWQWEVDGEHIIYSYFPYRDQDEQARRQVA